VQNKNLTEEQDKNKQSASTNSDQQPDSFESTDIQETSEETKKQVLAIDNNQEKINLGINWAIFNKSKIFDSLSHYDVLVKTDPNSTNQIFSIFEGPLPNTSGQQLHLSIKKIFDDNYGSEDQLTLDIVRSGINDPDKKYVADFDFVRQQDGQAERWDMKHRNTNQFYRKQGIAGQVLSLIEEFLRQRTKDKKIDQYITLTSGQKSLTNWVRSRLYGPKNEEDKQNLKRLEEGDDNLQQFSESEIEDYTFDIKEFKEKFPNIEGGPANPMVWDGENYSKPFFYMKSSFLIELEKKIQ